MATRDKRVTVRIPEDVYLKLLSYGGVSREARRVLESWASDEGVGLPDVPAMVDDLLSSDDTDAKAMVIVYVLEYLANEHS